MSHNSKLNSVPYAFTSIIDLKTDPDSGSLNIFNLGFGFKYLNLILILYRQSTVITNHELSYRLSRRVYLSTNFIVFH